MTWVKFSSEKVLRKSMGLGLRDSLHQRPVLHGVDFRRFLNNSKRKEKHYLHKSHFALTTNRLPPLTYHNPPTTRPLTIKSQPLKRSRARDNQRYLSRYTSTFTLDDAIVPQESILKKRKKRLPPLTYHNSPTTRPLS